MENIYILSCAKGEYDTYYTWIESIHKTEQGAIDSKIKFDKDNKSREELYNKYEVGLNDLLNKEQKDYDEFINKVGEDNYKIMNSVRWDGIADCKIISYELRE